MTIEVQDEGTICFDGQWLRVKTRGRTDPAVAVIRDAPLRRWNGYGKYWWMHSKPANEAHIKCLIEKHGYKLSDEAHTALNNVNYMLPLETITYDQPPMKHGDWREQTAE